MSRRVLLAASAVLLLGLSGCATYLDARANVAPGGKIDQQKAEAARGLNMAHDDRALMQVRRSQQETQLAGLEEQVRSLQRDQRRQEVLLAEALRARKISKVRHDQLSKAIQSVKADTEAIQMKVNLARLQSSLHGVSESNAEFKKVEARHEELRKVMSLAMGS